MTKTDGLKRTGRGVLAGVALAAAMQGASARAQDVDGLQSVKVFYGDLDLATPKGVAIFDARLRWAAEDIYPAPSYRLTVPVDVLKARSQALAKIKPRRDELIQAAIEAKTPKTPAKAIALAGR